MIFGQILSKQGFDFSPLGNETNNEITAKSEAMAISVTTSSNGPLCAGATLDLTATPAGGVGPYLWQWTGPNGFSAAQQNPFKMNTTTSDAGTYFVTVTDQGAANATATSNIAVVINPPATANAGADKVVCKGTPVVLAGVIGGGAINGVWTSSGGGSFSPNANTLNATYTPPANFVGTIILTLTTNDPAGPCGAVSDQSMVQYGDPDALVCHDLVQISLDEDCTLTVTPDMLLEGAVLEPLYSVTLFTLQGINIGNTITAQYVNTTLKGRTRDNCTGNICFTDIHVIDALPPVLNCQDIFLPCAVSNSSPYYLRDVLGIAAGVPSDGDNCGAFTLTYFDSWVDVPCGASFNGYSNLSGYIKRIWTAKDASNNTSHCTQYLYYQKVLTTQIQFPASTTVSCNTFNSSPMSTGVPYFTAFGQQFGLSPNEAFCDVEVTFDDSKITTCAGSSIIIRKWQAFDPCLPFNPLAGTNPVQFSQTITVNDLAGPAMICPANMTVSTNALECCAITNLPDIIVEDFCSYVQDVSAVIVSFDPYTGDTTDVNVVYGGLSSFPGNNLQDKDTLAVMPLTPCLEIGYHIVTYIAEDGCGVSSSCTFRLTINDATPPLAVCVEVTQVSLGADGMIQVLAKNFDNGSYDNCGDVFFKVRRITSNTCQTDTMFHDFAKFCCSDIGDTVEVTMRVYDTPVDPGPVSFDYESQHSNDCTVQVYVDDKLKPVCIPPANTTVSCEGFDPSLWAYGASTAVDNCCLDTIITTASYANFDTVCNRGTIVRTFRAFDCMGNSNSCTQRVVVTYQQGYYVRFPNDVLVTSCNGTGAYGEPVFYGKDCELMAVSYEDQIFTVVSDACFKIERTWTVINWCQYNPNTLCTYVPNPNPNVNANSPLNLPGPTVSAFGTAAPWAPTSVKINPSDQTATNYSTFYNPNVNCYKYKQIIKISDGKDPVVACPTEATVICDDSENNNQLWNATYWTNSANDHDLCEAPSEICITATDDCSGANLRINYLLFLDLNDDGIMETVVNSRNLPGFNNVQYGNAANPNFSGGTSQAFDTRPVGSNQKYGFTIQTYATGNNLTGCVKWNTAVNPSVFSNPQLPHGRHKIKWLIEDGCGNETNCEYFIDVKDCKAPVITCINGLSVNIMTTGMVPLYASSFLQHAEDNCTPSNQIKIGIRKAGTGSGFPYDAQGNPITTVSFSCLELGTQFVELWAVDADGNADFCKTYVIVQDNAGNCGQNATVAGALNTEMGNAIEDGNVLLHASPNNGLPEVELYNWSDLTGSFHFPNALPIASDYTIMPVKDDDPLNGVTTYDLVLISKHILGIEPLNSPYKMIAADANKNNTITTFDIVELRKLVLGLYNDLPSNTSWRFVDKSYVFPNPINPFEQPFPEMKTVASIASDIMDEDFVGIKIGDVNNSNVSNNLMQSDDRSSGTLHFDLVADKKTDWIKAGDIVTLQFKPEEVTDGYQFTLNFNGLDALNILPGTAMSDVNFANFADDHAITVSWDDAENKQLSDFSVQFRAVENGRLSQMVSVSNRITKAEAYKATADGLERNDIALRFNNADGTNTVSGVGFELYQNQPNPFVHLTTIGFHLPENSDAKLTVYDETGRVLYTERGQYLKGYNRIVLDGQKLGNSTALLYYKLETATQTATRKMVKEIFN